ncbi:MAG TPA: hypothetical protein VG079_02455, partial [Gaiellaceae bacterium]|nr:hypothetical protein [Gaiellaceae bacterium]
MAHRGRARRREVQCDEVARRIARICAGAAALVRALLSTAAVDLRSRVCSNSERGLLGIAVDPVFGNEPADLPALHASVAGACVNRVARFELSNANLVDPLNDAIVIDQSPS